ncbi:MAG: hypothetical protein DIU79_09505 [Actinobacteria bacterium]|nr:MAG: hypothetical protein DIU79_09505 [Actinomycetota bacterium]
MAGRARGQFDLRFELLTPSLAATTPGGAVFDHRTLRYRLGQLLGRITRNFLLMTATPHNGNEASFQAFMALLDPDRFATGKGSTPSTSTA